MHLYMIKNAEQAWTDAHDMLLPLLSEERQKKVLRYRFDSDKILSLYAGVLTRLALMRELSCSNDQLAFTQTDRKKPRLLPAPTHPYPVDFSFSHTRQAVLLGVTEKGQIGVDIEQIQSAPLRIMPSVFSFFHAVPLKKRCFLSGDLRSFVGLGGDHALFFRYTLFGALFGFVIFPFLG